MDIYFHITSSIFDPKAPLNLSGSISGVSKQEDHTKLEKWLLLRFPTEIHRTRLHLVLLDRRLLLQNPAVQRHHLLLVKMHLLLFRGLHILD